VIPSPLKNIKIKIYKTIILSVVLYGCETWSLTQREEYRLKTYDDRALRRIFRHRREDGEDITMRSFMTWTLQVVLG
jgi:hypothetical protein